MEVKPVGRIDFDRHPREASGEASDKCRHGRVDVDYIEAFSPQKPVGVPQRSGVEKNITRPRHRIFAHVDASGNKLLEMRPTAACHANLIAISLKSLDERDEKLAHREIHRAHLQHANGRRRGRAR